MAGPMVMPSLSQPPVISIIINNYNYGRYLAAAIDSALHQNDCTAEVIVVDDGSTDHSREVIARYGERIIPILKGNGGQASALNAGFARSSGEIILFLDADDVLLPETGRRVCAAFNANAGAAKVQYRMAIIDEAGIRTGQLKPPRHLPLPSGDLRKQVLSFPFDLTWMATSGNAFAARVLRQILPMPEAEYRILADFYLSHLTPLFGAVVFLDEVGAGYRVHRANHYEVAAAALNLDQVRQTIVYAQRTQGHIKHFAEQLGLSPPAAERSVSLLANRLVSLKFEPAQHPLAGDSVWRLFVLGILAARHRFDVSPALRLLFGSWFVATALAPTPCARWLAEWFLFPEKRGQFNQILRVLHGVQ